MDTGSESHTHGLPFGTPGWEVVSNHQAGGPRIQTREEGGVERGVVSAEAAGVTAEAVARASGDDLGQGELVG